MFDTFTFVVLGFAVFSCVSFTFNAFFFRRARRGSSRDASSAPSSVSVLIPVRDEADTIADSLDAILENHDVEFEVVVLDDNSSDATAAIVSRYAKKDGRVRLVIGQSLPSGWCGKQFACQQLAEEAKYEQLLFIDADVKLTSDAIARTVRERERLGVELLSGFPRQQVGTLGEALLIPLMYIVLLTYLPFVLMRKTRMVGASAGCGQLFLVSKESYFQSGGHASIRSTLHDGVRLPRSFRASGFRTDVFDASDVAVCRMYVGWRQTWSGLMKNAHEGIASPRLIAPFTLLLTLGYVAPAAVALLWSCAWFVANVSLTTLSVAWLAAVISYVPRLVAAGRFDQAWRSVPLFPIAVLGFLLLQWTALRRHCRGVGTAWRGRVYTGPESMADENCNAATEVHRDSPTASASDPKPSVTG